MSRGPFLARLLGETSSPNHCLIVYNLKQKFLLGSKRLRCVTRHHSKGVLDSAVVQHWRESESKHTGFCLATIWRDSEIFHEPRLAATDPPSVFSLNSPDCGA